MSTTTETPIRYSHPSPQKFIDSPRHSYMLRGETVALRKDGTLATYALICEVGHRRTMNTYNHLDDAATALRNAVNRALVCSTCGRLDR